MLNQKEIDQDGVQGILHAPIDTANGAGVMLTHGAGADCRNALLTMMADKLAEQGFYVFRCNMAFRQRRRTGPPHPSKSGEDRSSLRQAATFLRGYATGRIILGGHSYGGRQVTILASEDKSVADQLLLLSYPLHPPAKPEQLRTAHFPKLKVPAVFVQGATDPFGTPEEMKVALDLIPAATQLLLVEKAGHELLKGRFDMVELLQAIE